jgi:hypothetical protein
VLKEKIEVVDAKESAFFGGLVESRPSMIESAGTDGPGNNRKVKKRAVDADGDADSYCAKRIRAHAEVSAADLPAEAAPAASSSSANGATTAAKSTEVSRANSLEGKPAFRLQGTAPSMAAAAAAENSAEAASLVTGWVTPDFVRQCYATLRNEAVRANFVQKMLRKNDTDNMLAWQNWFLLLRSRHPVVQEFVKAVSLEIAAAPNIIRPKRVCLGKVKSIEDFSEIQQQLLLNVTGCKNAECPSQCNNLDDLQKEAAARKIHCLITEAVKIVGSGDVRSICKTLENATAAMFCFWKLVEQWEHNAATALFIECCKTTAAFCLHALSRLHGKRNRAACDPHVFRWAVVTACHLFLYRANYATPALFAPFADAVGSEFLNSLANDVDELQQHHLALQTDDWAELGLVFLASKKLSHVHKAQTYLAQFEERFAAENISSKTLKLLDRIHRCSVVLWVCEQGADVKVPSPPRANFFCSPPSPGNDP